MNVFMAPVAAMLVGWGPCPTDEAAIQAVRAGKVALMGRTITDPGELPQITPTVTWIAGGGVVRFGYLYDPEAHG